MANAKFLQLRDMMDKDVFPDAEDAAGWTFATNVADVFGFLRQKVEEAIAKGFYHIDEAYAFAHPMSPAEKEDASDAIVQYFTQKKYVVRVEVEETTLRVHISWPRVDKKKANKLPLY